MKYVGIHNIHTIHIHKYNNYNCVENDYYAMLVVLLFIYYDNYI